MNTPLAPEEGSRSSFRNGVFSECWTIKNIQKPSSYKQERNYWVGVAAMDGVFQGETKR